MKRIFFDSYGLRMWAFFAALALAVIVVIAGVGAAAVAAENNTCNRHLDGLHLEGHYDLWASTCFARLPDGRSVDVDSLRFNEQGQLR